MELVGFGVVLAKCAVGDVVPQAVQGERVAFDSVAHEGEGHQVVEAGFDGFEFKRAGAGGFVSDVLDAFVTGAQDVHPAADKAGLFVEFGGSTGAHVMAALDAATA